MTVPQRVRPASLQSDDAAIILRLRLLIARAAQPDSLRWWEDRSLTAEGLYLAERLFARRPLLAAAKIAMRTARVRHAATVPQVGAWHLFDLGDEAEYALARIGLDEAWIPVAPVPSAEFLLDTVASLIPDGSGYSCQFAGSRETLTGPLEIQLSADVDRSIAPLVARASALALAYDNAGHGRPIFPYMTR